MQKHAITKKEMLDALDRSGYLLESKIAKDLSQSGFFIESNQVIEDPVTGKNREIDLTAEYYSENKFLEFKIFPKIKFVFEIKNNIFPVVLLTDFEFSPNIIPEEGLKEALTIPLGINYPWYDSFYKEIIYNRKPLMYTQYCSFHKKKSNDELMALHPDSLYEGLSKITHYCEQMIKLYDQNLVYKASEKIRKQEKYLRHRLFIPILLINDDLYELRNEKLIKVESSILMYNYHFNKEPKIANVFVVTKKGYKKFIKEMLEIENIVGEKMINTIKESRRL